MRGVRYYFAIYQNFAVVMEELKPFLAFMKLEENGEKHLLYTHELGSVHFQDDPTFFDHFDLSEASMTFDHYEHPDVLALFHKLKSMEDLMIIGYGLGFYVKKTPGLEAETERISI